MFLSSSLNPLNEKKNEKNIHYGLEQLFRRLSKTVSIVFFIDFKSKFDFS